MIASPHQHPSLSGIQQRLLRLAQSVDDAIISAQQLLLNSDLYMAQRVITADMAHNSFRDELEIEVHRLLVQAPGLLGSDLRTVTSALLLAAELERIGDYAKGIAMLVVQSAEWNGLEVPAALNQMAHKAREILQRAMRAVVIQDAFAVQRLREEDKIVDDLYQQVRSALLTTMRDHPHRSEWATYQLWIGHNLERIADRGVNIAARAAFIATGRSATQDADRMLSVPGNSQDKASTQG